MLGVEGASVREKGSVETSLKETTDLVPFASVELEAQKGEVTWSRSRKSCQAWSHRVLSPETPKVSYS